jgi:hypothetical protein
VDTGLKKPLLFFNLFVGIGRHLFVFHIGLPIGQFVLLAQLIPNHLVGIDYPLFLVDLLCLFCDSIHYNCTFHFDALSLRFPVIKNLLYRRL